jgi:nitroimidazol reductase NimA-like FMN-containing flavoprotein (pyridoxamine 5'-phosphate oxidase superfamily)
MAAMQPDNPVLEELSRAECLRLLATATIGRISYTRQALPAVEPVNFALHHGAIVIRTDAGGKLAAATRRAVVAFQADDLDLGLRSGWSVTVVGRCDEVTDTADLAGLDKLDLESWAPGTRNHFIRIELGIVTGRRLRGVRGSG